MITIFHVLAFLGCAVGLVLGAVFGHMAFGWPGTLVGISLGAYLGLLLGRLPRVIAILVLRESQTRTGGQPDTHKQQLRH